MNFLVTMAITRILVPYLTIFRKRNMEECKGRHGNFSIQLLQLLGLRPIPLHLAFAYPVVPGYGRQLGVTAAIEKIKSSGRIPIRIQYPNDVISDSIHIGRTCLG